LLRSREEGRVEIVYGAGWDPSRQRLVGVLTADRARRRDRSGDPYSVLVVGGVGPRLLIDVCWQRWYLAVWVFDPARRRTGKFDFRRLEDERMFLARTASWRYADGHAEFDERAWHRTVDIALDGRASIQTQYAAEKGGPVRITISSTTTRCGCRCRSSATGRRCICWPRTASTTCRPPRR
jgi:hypothetical protein